MLSVVYKIKVNSVEDILGVTESVSTLVRQTLVSNYRLNSQIDCFHKHTWLSCFMISVRLFTARSNKQQKAVLLPLSNFFQISHLVTTHAQAQTVWAKPDLHFTPCWITTQAAMWPLFSDFFITVPHKGLGDTETEKPQCSLTAPAFVRATKVEDLKLSALLAV